MPTILKRSKCQLFTDDLKMYKVVEANSDYALQQSNFDSNIKFYSVPVNV